MRYAFLLFLSTLATIVSTPQFRTALEQTIALLPTDVQAWSQCVATVATLMLVAWARTKRRRKVRA